MTAKELAEKIEAIANDCFHPSYSGPETFLDRIEPLLTAALEEARKKHHCYECHDLECADDTDSGSTLMEHIADCFACNKAKKEAYESCAKIAEEGPPPGGVVHCDGDVRDPGVVVSGFQKWIADAIRQRAEELK